MASGLLGKADLVAATVVNLYTVPTGKVTTANIRIANRNSFSVRVRVAITNQTTPGPTDYISYDIIVPANGIYEDIGVAISAGESIFVRSDTSAVSTRAHGFEGTPT